jgi:hypothetical protein
VQEIDLPGVQGNPRHGLSVFCFAEEIRCHPPTVQGVTEERETGSGEVGSYLMRIATKGLRGNQCGGFGTLDHVNPGLGGFPDSGIDDRPVPAVTIHAEWVVDNQVIPRRAASNQAVVGFVDLPGFKGHVQQPVHTGRARQDHHTARVFVQAMDDPQPAKIRFQQPVQVRFGWIIAILDCQQAGWFIDSQDMFVFPKYADPTAATAGGC